MDPSADDHRRHREEHRPERRWKHLRFKNFRALYEFRSGGEARHKIFDLFTCTDEIEHRHALCESYKERRE